MEDHHIELGKQESREATEITSYDKFIEAVERELGHDLDGVQWIDGYSLDYARDFFDANRNTDRRKFIVEDYVKMVKYNKEQAERGELFWVVGNKQLEERDEDGGEHRAEETILYVGKATDEQVEKYIDEYYAAEHCQHEYDCCGHWYANRASYKRRGDLVIVTQSFYINI